MKFKMFNVAIAMALSTIAISASAQKKYTDGVAVYTVSTAAGDGESTVSFSADSSIAATQQGPAAIKIISTTKGDYLAVLVDVPIASIKKAAIASPSELEQFTDARPKFTFAPTTETKTISGFNCKKVTVTNTKDNKTYEAWVTNDIDVPVNGVSILFKDAGGVPVEFVTIQQGQEVKVSLKTISEKKNPKGTFGIPSDFDKITFADLAAMRGGE